MTADPDAHEILLYGWLGAASTDPERPQDSNDAILVRTDDAGPQIVRSFRIGTLEVALIDGGRVDVEPLPAAHQWRGVVLGYLISGELRLEQGGHVVQMRAGDFAFYTGAQPYRIIAPNAHRYLIVRIPTTAIALRHSMFADVVAMDLSQTPSAGVLRAVLRELASPEMRPTVAASAHLADAVVAAAHAVIADARPAGTAKAMSMFNALVLWLEEHLAETDLSAERLAEAHYLSVRHVRRVFTANGTTVSAFVRQRRLERIRDDLVDPRHAREPVHTIAERWAMSDAAVFSRAFSRHFGETPRRYRALYLLQGHAALADRRTATKIEGAA
jgi:AraC-like DNA-binding protein